MKQNFTIHSNLKVLAFGLIIFLFLSAPFQSASQNLLLNSGFNNGSSNWTLNGMQVEVNPESVYGGSSSSNKTAEIDAQVGLRQKVAIIPGYVYTLTLKASRRTSGGTIANPGITIRVTGDVTGTAYVNTTKSYNNTIFAFTTETFNYTIPSGSADRNVTVEITRFNNTTTLGVIVDDVQLIGANNASLPVHFTQFTGELRNNTVLLTWKTENETNNSHFIIEKSSNGYSFDSIGRMAASNRNAATYTFTDTKVTPTNIYRIRQVDIDGAAIFSKMIVMKKGTVAGEMKVFPSTVSSTIQYSITLPEKSLLQVSIIEVSGRVVMQERTSVTAGAFQQSLSVEHLTSGTYYLQVKNSDGSVNITKTFQKLK